MVDQRRFDNQRKTISAAEAAIKMKVKVRTLYAYAARGLLRSFSRQDGLAHDYLLDDIERLIARKRARAGHGAAAAGALRWGEPVLETAISDIDERGPIYREHPAVELAVADASFESVAELLWHGTLTSETKWPRDRALLSRAPKAAKRPPPLAQLTLTLATLGATDSTRMGEGESATITLARVLIPTLAAALAPSSHRAAAFAKPHVADVLLTALGGETTARARRACNRALVLSADHELNVSTFAARIAASAGADIYACLAAASAAASGPEHAAYAHRVEAFIAEIAQPKDAKRTVQQRLQHGEAIPGFGHRLYKRGDPRALPLLETAHALAPRHPTVQKIFAVVNAMHTLGREEPTIDSALVALCAALALPAGSSAALFAIGRTAGWIAHVLEQRRAGYLLRPRARYVGGAL